MWATRETLRSLRIHSHMLCVCADFASYHWQQYLTILLNSILHTLQSTLQFRTLPAQPILKTPCQTPKQPQCLLSGYKTDPPGATWLMVPTVLVLWWLLWLLTMRLSPRSANLATTPNAVTPLLLSNTLRAEMSPWPPPHYPPPLPPPPHTHTWRNVAHCPHRVGIVVAPVAPHNAT